MNEYKRLLTLIKPHIWLLAVAVLFALVAQSMQGVSLVGGLIPAVDRIVSGKEIVVVEGPFTPAFVKGLAVRANAVQPVALLNVILLVVGVALILKSILEFFNSYFLNKVSERVMRNVRERLFNKLVSLSFDFYAGTPTGNLVSRIIYDVTVLKNSLSQGLVDLITKPIVLIINLAVVLVVKLWFGISWAWIIAGVILVPTIAIPVRLIGKRLKKIALKMQQKMSDISVLLHETFSGIRIVKAFLMEPYEKKRFAGHNANFYRMTMKAIKRTLLVRPITEAIAVLCVVSLVWFSRYELLSKQFSYGAFVALALAIMLLLKPIKALSRVYVVLQQGLAASSRIFEILDKQPSVIERPGSKALPPIKNGVRFRDVSFRYYEKEVLININLTVDKGEVLAIVGSSGVGKTTLINLIPRFYDVSGGSVTIDGTDIRDVTLNSLRGQIGMVTQDLILFNDTVKFNIAYGRGDSPEDEKRIVEAARIANAHDFIVNLPQGYDTVIGEKGVRISGGEKQRLAIARAMFKNPPILILDEATSHLDAESERLVQDALNRLMAGRTVFVIAHRLSTIKHATKIVTLEKGAVKETGTHKELMEDETLYRRLYELQFKEY